MFFKGSFQMAYVTHDYDKAKALLTEKFGLENWLDIDADMVMKMADGSNEPATCKVGLVWQAGQQIELIQPLTGYRKHYEVALPQDTSDFVPRFHHLCVRRDDLPAMRKEMEELDIPYAFEGEVHDDNGNLTMIFAYLDARETLGHFLEFIWATPETWDWQGWPKEKPVF